MKTIKLLFKVSGSSGNENQIHLHSFEVPQDDLLSFQTIWEQLKAADAPLHTHPVVKQTKFTELKGNPSTFYLFRAVDPVSNTLGLHDDALHLVLFPGTKTEKVSSVSAASLLISAKSEEAQQMLAYLPSASKLQSNFLKTYFKLLQIQRKEEQTADSSQNTSTGAAVLSSAATDVSYLATNHQFSIPGLSNTHFDIAFENPSATTVISVTTQLTVIGIPTLQTNANLSEYAHPLDPTLYTSLLALNYLADGERKYPFIHLSTLKEYLKTVKDPLVHQKLEDSLLLYAKPSTLNVRFPKGVLFHGPPGTGKSTIALKTCTQLGIKLTNKNDQLDSGRFLGGLVGDTSKNINAEARVPDQAPYLLHCMMLDEAETIVPERKSSKESHKVDGTNTMLSLIADTMNTHPNLIFHLTTNNKTMLEPAVLRARRIDSHIFMGPLFEQDRARRLELHPELAELLQVAQFKRKILDMTINFTQAQIDLILELFTHGIGLSSHQELYGSTVVAKNFDKLQQIIQAYLTSTLEQNVKFNKLNPTCKSHFQFEDDFRTFLQKNKDRMSSGTLILTNDAKRNKHSYLEQENISGVCTVNETPGNADKLIHALASCYASCFGMQSVSYLNKYSMKKVQEDLDGMLVELMEQSREQTNSMIIIRLDDLVGIRNTQWSTTEQQNVSVSNTSGSSSGTSDSTSTNVGGSVQISKGTNSSTSKTFTSGGGTTTTNGTNTSEGQSDGKWNWNRGTNQSCSTATNFSESKGTTTGISEQRSEGTSFGKTEQHSVNESINSSVSKQTGTSFSYNYTLQLQFPEVYHSIVRFVLEAQNLQVNTDTTKPFIMIVIENEFLYGHFIEEIKFGTPAVPKMRNHSEYEQVTITGNTIEALASDILKKKSYTSANSVKLDLTKLDSKRASIAVKEFKTHFANHTLREFEICLKVGLDAPTWASLHTLFQRIMGKLVIRGVADNNNNTDLTSLRTIHEIHVMNADIQNSKIFIDKLSNAMLLTHTKTESHNSIAFKKKLGE